MWSRPGHTLETVVEHASTYEGDTSVAWGEEGHEDEWQPGSSGETSFLLSRHDQPPWEPFFWGTSGQASVSSSPGHTPRSETEGRELWNTSSTCPVSAWDFRQELRTFQEEQFAIHRICEQIESATLKVRHERGIEAQSWMQEKKKLARLFQVEHRNEISSRRAKVRQVVADAERLAQEKELDVKMEQRKLEAQEREERRRQADAEWLEERLEVSARRVQQYRDLQVQRELHNERKQGVFEKARCKQLERNETKEKLIKVSTLDRRNWHNMKMAQAQQEALVKLADEERSNHERLTEIDLAREQQIQEKGELDLRHKGRRDRELQSIRIAKEEERKVAELDTLIDEGEQLLERSFVRDETEERREQKEMKHRQLVEQRQVKSQTIQARRRAARQMKEQRGEAAVDVQRLARQQDLNRMLNERKQSQERQATYRLMRLESKFREHLEKNSMKQAAVLQALENEHCQFSVEDQHRHQEAAAILSKR